MKPVSTACDIIIPTYNNAAVISLTLTALFTQRIDPSADINIIISDDGSTDHTVSIVRQLQTEAPWPLTILAHSHHGAAAARNRAFDAGVAPLILLVGGDILLRPGALAAHLDFHEQYPAPPYAALGHVTWDPRLPPSPFMAWMTHGGPQNNFDALLGKTDADPRHYFYGSHLSLKRAILAPERWQEQFGAYGWEDLELGRRLATRGLKLKPHFTARSLHHHAYTVRDISRRQQAAGASLPLYQALHPRVPLLPPPTGRAARKLWLAQMSGAALALRLFLYYSGKRWATPRLFNAFTAVEYWRGMLTAQQR